MNLLCLVWTGSQYLHLDLHASHGLVMIPDQALKQVQAEANIRASFYTVVLKWVTEYRKWSTSMLIKEHPSIGSTYAHASVAMTHFKCKLGS
jgi:hypothetical protein